MAGADPLFAVERDAAKLELARRRGATHAIDSSGEDVVARVLELSGGGVDHAFEAIGRPETVRQAWDVLRPGATAVVVGAVPRGVELSLPGFDLLSEKGLKGCYYGSGDAAAELEELAQLVAEGRFPVADVVTHLTGLDGIEDAFARLRRGEGARTVVVLDPELAGAPESLP
jgi:S-(hydroxymethyl)glutathione dehydrogenase/alcohol dehydrogenase